MKRHHIVYSNDQLFPSTETDTQQIMHTVSALGRLARVTLALPTPRVGAAPDLAALCRHYEVEPSFELRLVPNPLFVEATPRGTERSPGGLPTRLGALRRLVEKMAHTVAWRRDPAWRAADWLHTRNLWTALAFLETTTLPVLYETYRPWPHQISAAAPLFRRLVSHPRFLGLVSHSAYNGRLWQRHAGLTRDRLLVAHNGIDTRKFAPLAPPEEARTRLRAAPEPALEEALRRGLRLDAKSTIVGYLGHISEGKGIGFVLRLAAQLPELTFLLVGATKESDAIRHQARGTPNVAVLPWQISNDMRREYLQASDILMIPPSARALEAVGNTVLPIKIFEYLAAGRTIFAGRTDDLVEVLRDDENSCLVPPDDLAIATRALSLLAADEPRRRRLARAAAIESAGYSLDERARRILEFARGRLPARGGEEL